MLKIKGFTLAEVLITLGVIGVVSAITMPVLIKNYQKHVWVNQLKKSISTIQNGFKLAMAQDGVDNLQDTELWQSANFSDQACSLTKVYSSYCGDEFNNNLLKYFKGTIPNEIISREISFLVPAGNNQKRTEYVVIKFPDGAQILSPNGINIGKSVSIITTYGPTDNAVIVFSIDVNGEKLPNKYGRDVFSVAFSKTGNLEDIRDIGMPYNCSPSSQFSLGSSCTTQIIKDGWKMNY